LKKRTMVVGITTFFCLFLMFADSTRACVCNESFTPPCAAFWRADAVFIGTVIEIAMPSENSNVAGPPGAVVHFQVGKVFKGAIDAKVQADSFVGDCFENYDLKVGEQYLVYVHRKNADGRFELRPCDRTGLLADVGADLDYIKGLSTKKKQSIAGMVSGLTREEMKDVRVVVKGDRTRIEASMNEVGIYRIEELATGNYDIELFVPATVSLGTASSAIVQTSTTKIEYKVSLIENQCDYREIKLDRVANSKAALN
jgi:hypothetical protein